ncbi:hypothetical protein R6Q57_013533 [Mikania cordata]
MGWLLVVLKTVFSLLTCGMFVVLCYGVSTDYYLSCLDPIASFTTCGYIVWQFFKLSPEESLNDPIYFVLRRRQRREDAFCVVSARVIVVFLGCFTLGTSVFVFVIDGFPFRADVLSSTYVNFLLYYFNLITNLSDAYKIGCVQVWIGYKESSWINAFIWILLIACFGSITMCAYIAKELFYISPGQPLFLILFNKSNRDLMLSDPLLTKHNNV